MLYLFFFSFSHLRVSLSPSYFSHALCKQRVQAQAQVHRDRQEKGREKGEKEEEKRERALGETFFFPTCLISSSSLPDLRFSSLSSTTKPHRPTPRPPPPGPKTTEPLPLSKRTRATTSTLPSSTRPVSARSPPRARRGKTRTPTSTRRRCRCQGTSRSSSPLSSLGSRRPTSRRLWPGECTPSAPRASWSSST